VFSPVAWWTVLRDTLVYHPAMSMTALVVAAFGGRSGQRLRVPPPVSPRPVTTVSATPTPKLTEQQLQSAGSANVALGNAVGFAHAHGAGATDVAGADEYRGPTG